MKQLPEALRPFEAYKQFILWRTIDEDGKKIKLPVDYRTGRVGNAHDPGAWMSAADAINVAGLQPGDGVAFVFTDADPFFFLDLDNCLAADGQSWTPAALDVLARLPGAAVEVSQSGRGLHVFGRTAPLEHRCKNISAGLELYTSGRFVALTGDRAAGSAAVDLTGPLAAVVADLFSPATDNGAPLNWTTEPAADWAGPADDAELIKRALRSKSAAAAFGTRCTFADLWKADPDALAAAYPADDGRPHDASSADAALAQHLAFWTGGDCERMFRLFWGSALVREKWNREDYLHRTIIGAAAKQTGYYVERGARPAVDKAAPTLGEQGPEKVGGYQLLGADQQIEHFAGCVYVQSLHRVFTPSGALLKPDQFNATYGGYEFQREEGGKTTRKAWEAFTESQVVRYPKAESVCFRPGLEPGAIITVESARLVNVYVPVETERAPGDPAPFLDHLAKVLPDENDRAIMLSYMAACIQHIGVKFQWCPLLQGTEGNGKTMFTRCVAHAVGKRYTHYPKAADIDNKFNGWLLNKIFIGVEDVYVADNRRELIEILKPMITGGDGLEIQFKGVDQVTADICANFILNSNHRDAIRKTQNDRRFAVFFTAQQSADDLTRDGMGGDYFPKLYAWLRGGGYAVVADFLATFPIPDNLNPAGSCHRAPTTSTTDAAVSESLGGIEQEIMELVEEGKTGFAGGWISSMALERMLDGLRVRRAIPRNRRREVLKGLGYDWHPALSGGRVPKVLLEEGGKPRLFIRTDHPDRALTDAGDVVLAYLRAQAGDGLKDPSGFIATPPPPKGGVK